MFHFTDKVNPIMSKPVGDDLYCVISERDFTLVSPVGLNL